MDDQIVMRDAPEAATLRTVTGWVSRHGRFYGESEDTARYDGCTHVFCNICGLPAKKSYTVCSSCRDKKATDRYNAMPRQSWDGNAMLYSDARDEYFFEIEYAEDSLGDGETLDDLRMVICVPNCVRHLDDDYFSDALPEDGELPECLRDAIAAFNAAIDNAPVLSWIPGKYALDINTVEFTPCGADANAVA